MRLKRKLGRYTNRQNGIRISVLPLHPGDSMPEAIDIQPPVSVSKRGFFYATRQDVPLLGICKVELTVNYAS